MEKINKEYPILSNWKFVFKEMYDLDHKYPWYIAVRSVAGFLAPFIAAIIPSAAISMVEKKADFLTFFGVMLAFVLGNMIMGIVSTKYDFLIKKKNYKVQFQSVQKKVISKIMTWITKFWRVQKENEQRMAQNTATRRNGMAGAALWICLRHSHLICWELSYIRSY